MSEDALNFLDRMHEGTKCFYCGNEYSISLNFGSPEESESCSACGSTLRKREVLEDHIPEQVSRGRDRQSYQSSRHDQSLLLGTGANYGSSSAYEISPSEINNIQIQNMNVSETIQPPIWVPNKGKKPVLEQQVSSPTQKFQEQLCNDLRGLAISGSNDEEDVLIYQRINHYIPENEIGLGCMLLKVPVSPPKESKPDSSAVFTFSASAPNKATTQPSTMFESPIPPYKLNKPEDSLMLQSHDSPVKNSELESPDAIRSPTSLPEDFWPQSPLPKNDTSALIDVPIKEASQDETLTLSEKTRRDRNSDQKHRMNTRRAYRSLKDIYASDTRGENKVEGQPKRSRRRPRKQKLRGQGGSSSEAAPSFGSTHWSLHEIQVALNTDYAQNRLQSENSDLVDEYANASE